MPDESTTGRKSEVATLTRERDFLRRSLERFGRHDDHCDMTRRQGVFGARCTCGLHAALAHHEEADDV